ncbi:hypothetical protein Tco_0907501 [Tanacetum coccineum]|uniref:Uncharacterized protein n=1 Tax=Tanacetum coccineum TaxID=301880 RepID=A0ABQ5CMW4_9ASTR
MGFGDKLKVLRDKGTITPRDPKLLEAEAGPSRHTFQLNSSYESEEQLKVAEVLVAISRPRPWKLQRMWRLLENSAEWDAEEEERGQERMENHKMEVSWNLQDVPYIEMKDGTMIQMLAERDHPLSEVDDKDARSWNNDPTNKTRAPQGEELGLIKPLSDSSFSCSDTSQIESLPDSSFAHQDEDDMTSQKCPYDRFVSLMSTTGFRIQAKEIKLLKANITKLKKQAKPVIKHHKEYLKSVSLQKFPRKSFSKKHRVHKESVSKQGRKKAKGESSVQRDPLLISSKGEEIKQDLKESRKRIKEREYKKEESTVQAKKIKSRKRRFKPDTSQMNPSDIEKENDGAEIVHDNSYRLRTRK